MADEWDKYKVAQSGGTGDEWDKFKTTPSSAPETHVAAPPANGVNPMRNRRQANSQRGITPEQSGARREAVTGLVESYPGVEQAWKGAEELATPGQRVRGASDVIRGMGKASAPVFLAPAVLANPVGTALGIAGGMAAQKGTEVGLKAAGVPDEYADLASDVAGMAGGYAASRPAVVGAARALPGKVARGAGNLAAEVVGKTTGAGAKAFKRAGENPSPELFEQMRNPEVEDVVSHLKDAAQSAKTARGNEYAQQLQQIAGGNHPPINNAPIVQALDGQLQQFRVGRVPPAPANLNAKQLAQWTAQNGKPGELDFNASPIGDTAQADIAKIDGLVRNWKDWSPVGADALQRRIGDFYSQDGQARAFVTAVRNDVSGTIKAQVPGYADMTSGYAKASQFLDKLRDLSLDSKNPGTAARKITTLMNQNNDYREGLVAALEPFSNRDLGGEIAGLALSKIAPRGIAGPATGSGLLYMISTGALSPKAAVAMAASSPRLMGELAVAMGKAAPLLSKAGAAIPNTPVSPGMGAAMGLMNPPERQQQPSMPPPGARQ